MLLFNVCGVTRSPVHGWYLRSFWKFPKFLEMRMWTDSAALFLSLAINFKHFWFVGFTCICSPCTCLALTSSSQQFGDLDAGYMSINPETSLSSPKGSTPIKSLPFSPSQFLNSPVHASKPQTSTPANVKTQCSFANTTLNTPGLLETSSSEDPFRTPRIRRTLLSVSPRTPTPFKNALKVLNETKMAHVRCAHNHLQNFCLLLSQTHVRYLLISTLWKEDWAILIRPRYYPFHVTEMQVKTWSWLSPD